MQFPYSLTWPDLSHIVKTRIPKVTENPHVFKKFQVYGQLDEREARRALNYGSPPILEVAANLKDGVFGNYAGKGDVIQLNQTIAIQYQELVRQARTAKRHRDRWDALIERAQLIIEAVILHEMVHWGDERADFRKQDLRAKQKGWKDHGHRFVRYAYKNLFTYSSGYYEGFKVKVPNMDIFGWLGWGETVIDGDEYHIIYDPTHNSAGLGTELTPPSIKDIGPLPKV